MNNLKTLVVVMAVAVIVFAMARPVCLHFMDEEDFARRRNVWFLLTITAFISPSFWLYVLVATPVLTWASRKDSNPVAFYVTVALVIPATLSIQIPTVGINQLFELKHSRILAFAVLFPAAWRVSQTHGLANSSRSSLADVLLVAYACLHLALMIPYESVTHTMRRGFLFSIDILLLYYVASRTCTNRRSIVEALAALGLCAALLAPMAVFEAARGWLLYQGIGEEWGAPAPFAYLMRGGMLRAQVSAGHAIALGNILALGFVAWLYLASKVPTMPVRRMLVPLSMWAGLLAAYSRGPWLAGVIMLLAYMALGPNALSRFTKASLGLALFAGVLLLSPLGAPIIDNLPFIGTVGTETVSYRQRLAESSWELIKKNPLFGSPYVLRNMEDLRQGQGIIDLINTYARVALFYGLTGLSLYVGFFFAGIRMGFRQLRSSLKIDPDLAGLGAVLVSCMVGLLFMMAVGGFGEAVERLGFLIAGLLMSYSRLGERRAPKQANAPAGPLLGSSVQPPQAEPK